MGVPPARLAADDPSTLRAICRAKVWKRGEPEPQAWTAELIDPYPNTEGSAGLYCYSTGTTHTNDGPETYFNNFKVYRDE